MFSGLRSLLHVTTRYHPLLPVTLPLPPIEARCSTRHTAALCCHAVLLALVLCCHAVQLALVLCCHAVLLALVLCCHAVLLPLVLCCHAVLLALVLCCHAPPASAAAVLRVHSPHPRTAHHAAPAQRGRLHSSSGGALCHG